MAALVRDEKLVAHWKFRYGGLRSGQKLRPTIEIIPDDVLLIFKFYRMMDNPSFGQKTDVEEWQTQQYFSLSGIPFLGLSNRLLSATHLATLELTNIPHSWNISPETVATLLSILSNLGTLSLGFQSPQSRPDWWSQRPPPPPERSVIPSLTSFYFKGVICYLEELLARIHTPQLDKMHITFFNQISFKDPQLNQFINRTPTLRACGDSEAHIQLGDSTASVRFRHRTPTSTSSGGLLITILCGDPDWQLSSLEQVCNSSLPPLSTVEDLHIEHRYSKLVWENDTIENDLWLRLLLPFIAVKNLYLSEEFAPGIAAALQELVGFRITEVLPNLRKVFVEGLEPSGRFMESIGQFAIERELSAQPVTVSDISLEDSNLDLM